MFLKHYCVCWECFNDVLKTSLKNVKLRYLKNICMMFLKFYITFYLHLQNVIEKCFRYNMYITFIKCYKNVMCLLGCTLPVGSCEAERSFPCLRRVKTYLCNRIGEDRLSGLIVMNMNHGMEIDLEAVCQMFIERNKWKMFSSYILYQ